MPSARNSLAVLIVTIALAGGAWFVVQAVKDPEQPTHATVLPERKPLPEFSLVDDENRPFTRERLLGQTSLLFFGFTHCPDICPATLQQLASARRRIAEASGPDGEASLPQIVLISVDPERDTPDNLKAYVEHFGDGVTGVTGTIDELRGLTSALGVFFEKRGTGDDYSIDHSAYVFVIDPDAALQALFGAPHKVDALAHDLPILMAAR